MDRQRLERIFDVLTHLAGHGPCTATELSRALRTPLSSTHDLLRAMAEARLVDVIDRSYGLGPRALRTALAVMDSVGVQRVARRHLERLAEDSGFDVYLAMGTGNRVVYVSRHPGRQHVNLDIPLGRSLLLHSTAVGKLFAAFDRNVHQTMMAKPRPAVTGETLTSARELDRDLAVIRRRRVSVSRGESLKDIVGLATPVFAPDQSLAAAVHVSALRTSLPTSRVGSVVEQMLATSAAIEAELAEPTAVASA
ncbi:IclR family transcriptional regulator C-terminal domain-containing protein [Streptomyces sp. NPDC005438]|uniref:IclR family transcriptional regulator n=1 Tax=Streptomyces sp. NPDC005438 TaxID=3156880 RepID=UPI0033A20539